MLASVLVMAASVLVGGGGVESARGEPPLAFERTIIDLGPVPDDQPIRQPFKFVFTGDRGSALTISHCHHCPEPETDRPRYEPGQAGLVILQLDTAGRHGDIQTTADVSVPGVADSAVTLRVKASVRPRIMVRPDFLTLRDLPRTAGGEANVVFMGRRPDFAVLSVSSESPWVELTLGSMREIDDLGDPCRGFDVAVKIKPGLPLGEVEIPIRATTNDPQRPQIGTTIDAIVVGELIAEPDHVTVGSLRPSEPFAAEFTLSARAGKPLFYGSVRLATAKVRGVPPMALDVEPGAEVGTLRVKVFGTAPAFLTRRTDVDVIVTEEGPDGRVVDELRVPIRLIVYRNPPAR